MFWGAWCFQGNWQKSEEEWLSIPEVVGDARNKRGIPAMRSWPQFPTVSSPNIYRLENHTSVDPRQTVSLHRNSGQRAPSIWSHRLVVGAVGGRSRGWSPSDSSDVRLQWKDFGEMRIKCMKIQANLCPCSPAIWRPWTHPTQADWTPHTRVGWHLGWWPGTGELDMRKIGQARNTLMDMRLSQVSYFL